MTERWQSEIVVVGAGPAGLAATCELAEAGREVLVVDEAPGSGGQIWRHRRPADLPAGARPWLARLAATDARMEPGVAVLDATEDGTLVAERGESRVEIRAARLILATGARELFLPFPGWTLPGVVGVGAAQALIKEGVMVKGWRVVLAGSGPLLLPVAGLLRQRGANVRLIGEQAPWSAVARFATGLWRQPGKIRQAIGYRWQTLSVPYRAGVWALAAQGDDRLAAVVLTDGRRSWTEPCDLLCSSAGLTPNTELARLLGCRTEEGRVWVDERQQTSREGVYCVGESTGIGGVEKSLLEGRIVAAQLAGRESSAAALRRRGAAARRFAKAIAVAFEPRAELLDRLTPETVVCRCEDVRWADLESDWSLRQAKLYARVGMGPCQARVCGAALRHLCGWDFDSVRPPVEPCRLSTLSG